MAGYALFILTEYSVWVAMLVFAYSRGGATIAGLVALAQLVPAAVLAPIAAAVGDRRSPVLLLADGYLAQAAGMAATAVAVFAGWPAAAYGRRGRCRRGHHDPPSAVGAHPVGFRYP